MQVWYNTWQVYTLVSQPDQNNPNDFSELSYGHVKLKLC
jgi:hypothetical protein